MCLALMQMAEHHSNGLDLLEKDQLIKIYLLSEWRKLFIII